MKKSLLLASLGLSTALLTACGGGDSGCSNEELQSKIATVTKGMEKLATTDLTKMQEISKKMTEASTKFNNAENMDAACKFYDEIIAEL